MKASTVLRVLAGGLAPFLIVSLNADGRESRSVKLPQSVSLEGTEVAPGVYEVEWRGRHANVRVSLRAGKTVVATATGKWVDRHVRCNGDVLICQAGEDRLGRVREMQFAGKSQVLVLDQTRSEAHLTSMAIPLCAVSSWGDAAAFAPGGECQRIKFLGRPSAGRLGSPADPYFGDDPPTTNHVMISQRK